MTLLTLSSVNGGEGGRQKDHSPLLPGLSQKGQPLLVTSTNVGIDPQNFLTFSFNPFATLVKHFKAIPSASHQLQIIELEPSASCTSSILPLPPPSSQKKVK